MAVPPAYADLGKSARDIFTKGYGKYCQAEKDAFIGYLGHLLLGFYTHIIAIPGGCCSTLSVDIDQTVPFPLNWPSTQDTFVAAQHWAKIVPDCS